VNAVPGFAAGAAALLSQRADARATRWFSGLLR